MQRRLTHFEHKNAPLLPASQFYARQLRFVFFAVFLIMICLAMGMMGYVSFAHMNWVMAFQNASMILSGMGEIDPMPDNPARIFSGVYALFSGVVFISTVAVMLAPAAHRLLHILHIESDDQH